MSMGMSEAEPKHSAATGSDLRAAFSELTGQELSDAGEAHLRRFIEKAGIRSNDALLLILFGFESYRNLYADIPKQVSDAAALVTRQEVTALKEFAAKVPGAVLEQVKELADPVVKGKIGELRTEAATLKDSLGDAANRAVDKRIADTIALADDAMRKLSSAAHSVNASLWSVGLLCGIGGGLVGGLAVFVAQLFIAGIQ